MTSSSPTASPEARLRDTADPDRDDPVRALKRTFGAYPTGVTVVTTMHDGAPLGFTANSFTSVSLDPPLVLVCHGSYATSHAAFRDAGGFAVNILAADQEALAMRFASRVEDRFAEIGWREGAGGALLDGAAAWLDCEMHATHEAGDHTILVGRVLDHHDSGRAGLLYSRGRFGSAG